MTELTTKTIAELRDGIGAGDFSAREVAEAYNAAVAAARALNAYTVETPELALAAADTAEDHAGEDHPACAQARSRPTPAFRSAISSGQKFVKEDCRRLKPTKAVNHSQ